MKYVLDVIGAILALALVATVLAFIYTLPVMYIWNWYVVPKFNAPILEFWDTLMLLIMIRLILPSNNASNSQTK